MTNFGSSVCPDEFDLLYDGWLVATRKEGSPASWICLDRLAEGVVSGHMDQFSEIYPQEYETDYDGYSHNQEVSCAVCRSQTSKGLVNVWGTTTCPSMDSVFSEGQVLERWRKEEEDEDKNVLEKVRKGVRKGAKKRSEEEKD
eukprot:Lithocolla_globosa_v1_NODE_559_length_3748_cov_59.463038.p5 type:complete len:143 gc:universal NODE_559_length_3748_cov_59.463038:3243-2815(-)